MRKPLFLSDHFAYHVTNRSNNKDWFYIPPIEAWGIFIEILAHAATVYETEIHTFVLMSNHYHAIFSTPRSNLNLFMRYFQTEVCRHIQRASGRINHIFGTRYKWSLLDNGTSFAYAYKYVLRNPVRAGLSPSAEAYPYSSLKLLMDGCNELPLTERRNSMWGRIPKETDKRLQWLNQPTPKESEELVGKALRRNRFQFSKGNDVRIRLAQLEATYGIAGAPATFSAEK